MTSGDGLQRVIGLENKRDTYFCSEKLYALSISIKCVHNVV